MMKSGNNLVRFGSGFCFGKVLGFPPRILTDFITMIPGVLILSPFAGAGGLMHEALMANPYETNIVAEALDRALSMELDERKMRMNQLKKREKRMDVDAWVRGFMAGMSTLNPRSVPGK